ncbi:hypothetical protein [Paenibacillus apiarius]|uniref:Uncharacterized protein n=1 Tax=Paenibacillus apiarius TaxID=46240 RepID=A0ABT4DPK1_9BACL|nr:hypothetical protein [Paenibacillus apiarius]MBN3524761.1 hypothetical protein [Paenibacillus apiarius]MCY9515649.1 hypothetical protein [Paenibacillus apiarius]MCY9519278.1 hypothetical protein [Paenibacillus apiarius]MCY9550914.1 hypothetical protein [Paenibacillus apiarius]MCY9558994.1 hypothetical protein [Paenibacillus apiarius]
MTTIYSAPSTSIARQQSIFALQQLLVSLTRHSVEQCHVRFVEPALFPEHSILIYSQEELNHPESPLRLKSTLRADEMLIAYVDSRGLLVTAGSEAAMEQACSLACKLISEQCASPEQRPRLTALFSRESTVGMPQAV